MVPSLSQRCDFDHYYVTSVQKGHRKLYSGSEAPNPERSNIIALNHYGMIPGNLPLLALQAQLETITGETRPIDLPRLRP